MKADLFRFIFEELKFVKSTKDARNLYDKFPYLVPRITGNYYRKRKAPLSLQIEPTNYCDVNCICCSRDRMSRKKGYMEFKLFQKIIDDAAQNNVKRIHLYLHGEPLLHPNIIDMVDYIKTRGMAFQMATNGMRLDKVNAKALLGTGVDSSDHIIFSILGHSKEVHEMIMKGVRHDLVISNILEFLELRKSLGVNGPVIETVMYVMPENKNEEAEFLKYWRNVADHVRQVGLISQQFAKYKREDGLLPPREKTCKNLWERMTIFWNGDVTICCADLDGNYILGNLGKESIKEIWDCKELLAIKNLHKEKQFQKLALCSNCDW
jgi:radical SAM protein with 4Fe4S-binding SPASM domain